MFTTVRIVALASLAALTAAGAAFGGPSMAARITQTTLDLEACKLRAQDVAKQAKFKVSKVLEFSVYAETESYGMIVRCAPEKGVVFFSVAGPRMERATSYVNEI